MSLLLVDFTVLVSQACLENSYQLVSEQPPMMSGPHNAGPSVLKAQALHISCAGPSGMLNGHIPVQSIV